MKKYALAWCAALPIAAIAQAADLPAPPDTQAEAATSTPEPLRFVQQDLNGSGEHPELCLTFNQRLDPTQTRSLAAAITLKPAVPYAPHVSNTQFCLGGLAYNTSYILHVSTAFHAANGARLDKAYTLNASFADRTPSVGLIGNGYTLPRLTSNGPVVQSVNVRTVRLHVLRMPPHVAAAQIGEGRISLDQTSMTGSDLAYLAQNWLTDVWHGTMAIDDQHNVSTSTAFPLATALTGKGPGLYLVTAENIALNPSASPVELALQPIPPGGNDSAPYNPAQYNSFAAHWVSLSNLGLTALRGTDGLHVSVRSLATGTGVADTQLALVAQSGDVLASTHTDSNGNAVFAPGLMRGTNANTPRQLIATQGNDQAIMALTGPWFDFSSRGAEGPGQFGMARAVIQTERGIYRPGETVHALVLLRDKTGHALTHQPLTVVLRRSDGQKDSTRTLTQDQDGGYTLQLPISRSAPAGPWRIEVMLDPTSAPLAATSFQVADFTPQTLTATLKAPDQAVPDQSMDVQVAANFLYGAPASDLRVEGEWRLVPNPTPLPAYKDWVFGYATETLPDSSGNLDFPPTDAKGNTLATVPVSLPPGLTQRLAIALTARVIEPSGHPITKVLTVPLRRTAPLIGLHVAPTSTGDAQTAVPVSIVTLNPDGTQPLPLSGLRWTLSRVNSVYDWAHVDGRWEFHEHQVDVPVTSGSLTTDKAGRGSLTPSLDWGSYRLSVDDPTSGAGTSTVLHVGWAATAGDTTPDALPVSVRDHAIAPGGSTVLHIPAGLDGMADITFATDHVLSTQSVTVPKDGADVPVTAGADWGVGAYALVTLHRPLSGPRRPHDPVRAVGIAWIGINQDPHHLSVALGGPDTIRPRQQVTIPVDVHGGPGAPAGQTVSLTLAAVDEGILALTHYNQTNLFDTLFGKPALGVDMRDTYGTLLLDMAAAGRIREGGDDGEGEGGADITTARSVSLFSGPVTLDAHGHGQVTLDIPDFEGALRLMASAWSQDGVGDARRDITVRDPVFPDLALPRFIAPGDTAQPLLSIVNTDGQAGTYTAHLTVSGPLQISGPSSLTTELKPGERKSTRVSLNATAEGEGHLHLVLTRAGSNTALLTRDWVLTSRAGHAPFTTTHALALPAGASATVDPTWLNGIAPSSLRATLGFSAARGIDTVALLETLNTTPWGDSQTLAAIARPLLSLKNPTLSGPAASPATLHAQVQATVDTLLNRQNAAGRFGLTRLDDGQGLPETQDYITDFLTRAKTAGYAVPENRLRLALDLIESTQLQAGTQDQADDTPTSPEDAANRASQIASDRATKAYAAYILARAGRLHPQIVRDMAQSIAQHPDGAGFSLIWADSPVANTLATPVAIGHIATAQALDDAASTGPLSPDTLYDAAIAALGPVLNGPPPADSLLYWAHVRDLTGLMPLTAEGHDEARTQALADRYAQLSIDPGQLDAPEKAALLETVAALNADMPGRSLSLNGQAEPALTAHLPSARVVSATQVKKGLTVSNTGTRPLYGTLTVRGVPSGAVASQTAGLNLSVRYTTLSGEPLNVTHLKQNDRFVVIIKGAPQAPGLQRLGLLHMLPAGWGVESVLSTNSSGYDFTGPLSETLSTTFQADRLVALVAVNPTSDETSQRSFTIAYIARATMPGHYIRPETLVQVLGRPAIMARSASGMTDISPP